MRRLVWFFAGFVVALIVGGYAKRRVVTAAHDRAPTRVAQRAKVRAGEVSRSVRSRFTDAVHEGQSAMRERESELQPKP